MEPRPVLLASLDDDDDQQDDGHKNTKTSIAIIKSMIEEMIEEGVCVFVVQGEQFPSCTAEEAIKAYLKENVKRIGGIRVNDVDSMRAARLAALEKNKPP